MVVYNLPCEAPRTRCPHFSLCYGYLFFTLLSSSLSSKSRSAIRINDYSPSSSTTAGNSLSSSPSSHADANSFSSPPSSPTSGNSLSSPSSSRTVGNSLSSPPSCNYLPSSPPTGNNSLPFPSVGDRYHLSPPIRISSSITKRQASATATANIISHG